MTGSRMYSLSPSVLALALFLLCGLCLPHFSSALARRTAVSTDRPALSNRALHILQEAAMAGSTSQDESPSTSSSSSSAPLMRFRQRVSSSSSSSAAGAINPPSNANTLMMSPMVSVSSNMNTAATPSQPVFSSATGVHMGNGNTLELHQDAVGGTNSKEGEEHEGEAEGGADGLKLESSEATEQEFQRMLHESEEGRSEEEEKEKGGNGVVNSGSSNIKTDRHGNHYVMLTNNNVLAQSLPSAAQQMASAMASQMVAQQMVDLMKRRMEHEAEMMKEKEKIAQLQAQIAQAAAAGQQPPAPAPGTVTPAAPGAPGAPQSPQQQADAIAAAAIAAQQAAAEAKRRLAITFQDPWQNYGEGYEDVQAYRVGPLCVVQGMVKGNAGLVATLGPDCRPAGGRVVFALIRGNVVSRIDVMADGRVYVIAGGNDGWLSLSGLSFPVVPDRNPDLLNNWVDYGDSYKPASITKIGDLCVLGGMIRSGDWNLAFGRVTSDCFPNQRLVFSGDNHVGITEIDVLNTGYFVRAGGANEHGWVSLEGMGWCMAEGGNNLPQKNDWFPLGQDYRPPRYCMVQNLCVLSGVVKNDVDWNQVITELPQPCRPTKRLVFGTNVLLNSARVDVFPDGRVQYVSGKSNWAWLSLDGIKFIVADTGVAPGPTIPGSSAPVSQVVPALPSPIPASPAAMNAAAPGASSTPSPKN